MILHNNNNINNNLRNKRSSGDHPNYYINEIGQHSEKCLGELRRLALTQTPVKDHQLMLMWKTLKESLKSLAKLKI